MGTFTTKKILYGSPAQISVLAEQIRQSFMADGYDVRMEKSASEQTIYTQKVASLRLHWDFALH